MTMYKTAKHDWKVLDSERGMTVRQITNRFRQNKFEVQRAGRAVVLNDKEFDRLRTERHWIPRGLM